MKVVLPKPGSAVNSRKGWIGWTPLMAASDGGYLDIVEILFKKGKADLNKKREDGKTALDFAREKDFIEIVEYLKQKLQDKNFDVITRVK